jgi:hypothetical protein
MDYAALAVVCQWAIDRSDGTSAFNFDGQDVWYIEQFSTRQRDLYAAHKNRVLS